MKILQIGGLAGPGAEAGGVWAVATIQTGALQRAGHQVQLIGGWLARVPGNVAPGVQLFRVFRPFPGAGLRGLVSLAYVRGVWFELKNADVCHVHLSRDFMTTVALLLCRLRAVPVVAQTHGMYGPPRSRAVLLFDRLFSRLVTTTPRRWLTLASDEEAELVQRGIADSAMRRVSNAVTPVQLVWTPPATPHFVFISRLAARKQPTVFVAAAQRVLAGGWRAEFTLAGPDQGEGSAVERAIAAAKISDSCRYIGPLSAEEVAHLLARATGLVLPSRGEVYPMIALEAAAIGTPLLITSDSAISDVLLSANAALVFDPTVDEVAAAMVRVLGDPDVLGRLSRAGRIAYERHWTPESLLKTLDEVYRSVVTSA